MKREAEALQELGVALAALPGEVLDGLDLPEKLRHALEELGRITAHGGLRRQRQYVGKLMRDVDPEPLRAAVEATRRPGRDEARLFKSAEAWRERLLEGGDPVVERFASEYGVGDRAALAQLVAEARSGRPGAAKKLFRRIRDTLAAAQGPSGA
jgi:ribosome-associated protein